MLLLYYIAVLTNDTETTSISSDSTSDPIDPISIDPNAVTSPTTLTSLPTNPTPGTTSEQGRVFVFSTFIYFFGCVDNFTRPLTHFVSYSLII